MSKKRVLITGGHGFLGSHLALELRENYEVYTPTKKECNLEDLRQALEFIKKIRPEIIVHAATWYGGILFNQKYMADIYLKNELMNLNIVEIARLSDCESFVGIGSACAYPGKQSGTLSETQLWDGFVHESVFSYGHIKRSLLVQQMAYYHQYGLSSAHLLLANLYGPKDNFHGEYSHVIPALIKKFDRAIESQSTSVTVWGSGRAKREFLYVSDAAKAIRLSIGKIDKPNPPINIGTGIGTRISTLVQMIAEITGYSGKIEWDITKPDGVPEKTLDISNMKNVLNWTPEISLREGLDMTVKWYLEQKRKG